MPKAINPFSVPIGTFTQLSSPATNGHTESSDFSGNGFNFYSIDPANPLFVLLQTPNINPDDLVLTGVEDSLGGSSLEIPQLIKDANYTLTLAESGYHLYHTSASAHTYTIPANSSVAFPIGTVISFINGPSTGNVTIAITTDTMRLAGTTSTGSRTLGANGVATILKVASTLWYISGQGLT